MSATPAPAAPGTRLEEHLVVWTIGGRTLVVTSRPIVLGQNLAGIENAVEMPSNLDVVVLADSVDIQGVWKAPSRNVTIVARQLTTSGQGAAINVDGLDGQSFLPSAQAPLAGVAGAAQTGWNGQPGADGKPGGAGVAGGAGRAGQPGGTIRIYCGTALPTFDLTLSAVGGLGGDGQGGQDGAPGQPGGTGYDAVLPAGFTDGTVPTSGGRGGPGGPGGNGGPAGPGGAGGTIVFNAVADDAGLPKVSAASVVAGRAGTPGDPGTSGASGGGGTGGKGWRVQGYFYAPPRWGGSPPKGYESAAAGGAGGVDGVTDGTTSFVAPSAAFGAQDVGRLLTIANRGTYRIAAVASASKVTLNGTPAAGPSLGWTTSSIAPWGVPATDTLIAGGCDGTTSGSAFSAASGSFSAQDVGKLLVLPGRGSYRIAKAVANASSVTLARAPAAGAGLEWVLADLLPAACGPSPDAHAAGGSDGVTEGTSAFTVGSAAFGPADIGRLITIVGRGSYAVRAVVSATSVTLSGRPPVGSALPWVLSTIVASNDVPAAPESAIGGADGVSSGTATFTAASGSFGADDVGRLLSVAGKGSYAVTAVTGPATITLSGTPAAATGSTWVLGTLRPGDALPGTSTAERGGSDGATDGSTVFTAATGAFAAADVGKWVSVAGRGTFRITAIGSATAVTLSGAPGKGTNLLWVLATLAPDPTLPDEPDAGRGGTDGVTDGTTTFTAKSGSFSVADAGLLLSVAGQGSYRIAAVTDPSTVTLSRAAPAGTKLVWARAGIAYSWDPARDGTEVKLGACPVAPFANLVDETYLRMQHDRARFVYLSANVESDMAAFKDVFDRISWATELMDQRVGSPQELAPFVALYTSLDAMRTSLTTHLDYFGHGPRWVPKASFEFYKSQVAGAIADLAKAEQDCASYRQAFVAQLQNQSDLQDLAAQSLFAATELTKTISDTNIAILALITTLVDQDAAVAAANTTLRSTLQAWEDLTTKTFGGLTAEQFFDALSQLAFLPEDPFSTTEKMFKSFALGGSQVGKVASGLSHEATVTGDDGTPMSLTYVLNGVKTLDEGVSGLQEGLHNAPGGMLQADDPNMQMLLAQQQSLDQFCQRLYSTSAKAHDAHVQMEAYIEAVGARNATILRYNADLVVLRQAQASQKAAQRLHETAQNALTAGTTLGLAEAAHLIDSYLDRAREDCIRILYLTSRAYSLWSLKPDDTFHAALQLDTAWDFDSKLAETVNGQIVTGWTKDVEAGWSANGSPSYPPESFRRTGMRWELTPNTHPRLFAAIKKSGVGTVTLPPAHRLVPTGPFQHMAKVRLRVVRCWLNGVTSTDGLCCVRLTQHGDETFVAADDTAVQLTHDPVPIEFWYRCSDQSAVGQWQCVQNGDAPTSDGRTTVDGVLVDPNAMATNPYVAIGPFASWRIELLDVTEAASSGKGPTIDRTGLARITFEFFAFFDSFGMH